MIGGLSPDLGVERPLHYIRGETPNDRPMRSATATCPHIMLYWILSFFVLALISALFGFEFLASTFAGAAQILFFVFVALFLGMLLFNAFRPAPRT